MPCNGGGREPFSAPGKHHDDEYLSGTYECGLGQTLMLISFGPGWLAQLQRFKTAAKHRACLFAALLPRTQSCGEALAVDEAPQHTQSFLSQS